jgi:hypothetical protein
MDLTDPTAVALDIAEVLRREGVDLLTTNWCQQGSTDVHRHP